MTTTTTRSIESGSPSLLRRIAIFFSQHPRLSLILLLLLPMLWLGVFYVGSLSALLAQSFFSLDGFTGQIVRQFGLKSYQQLFTPSNTDIIFRTVTMAACVTVAAATIAFPLAYYMARYASYRMKGLLYLAVLLPLWSSYLVRVYTWKIILAQEGIITWFANLLGLEVAAGWCLVHPGHWRAIAVILVSGYVHRVCLHLAAIYDFADQCGLGTCP